MPNLSTTFFFWERSGRLVNGIFYDMPNDNTNQYYKDWSRTQQKS